MLERVRRALQLMPGGIAWTSHKSPVRVFSGLDLPGDSGGHQLMNRKLFHIQWETVDAGKSA